MKGEEGLRSREGDGRDGVTVVYAVTGKLQAAPQLTDATVTWADLI